MSVSSLFLTSRALGGLKGIHRQACDDWKMGKWTAFSYTVLVVLAHVFLKLEGPAWQRVRTQYRPWFLHLSSRPYRPADPLRYAFQALWVLFIVPPQEQGVPIWWRRTKAIWGGMAASLLAVRGRIIARLQHAPAGLREAPLAHRAQKALGGMGRSARRTLYVALACLALALTVLLITQPFTLFAQFLFVVLLWGLAMAVRRIPGQFSTFMLIVLSLTVSCRYIWWRYTSTLNMSDPMDVFFGSLLLGAETYSWIVLVLGYVQTAMPLRRPPAALPEDTDAWPTVDLMIPTYNEDLSVVAPTVYAALGMDWPKDKLRIHLLDDGRREAFRAFAEKVGINYIIRPDGRHAKAGNLNHALGKTDGDLVAIFDCDHIPTRSFLQMTVGWFLKDPKLALVQTPHHFFSPDPFERNLGHFGTQPNENTLFYGLVQDGNDLWNAAFFCGSCAVLRRSAIESIGGFAVETVTEDAHTALRLHRHGYNSAYLRIPQAAGLATESLSAHIGQRIRWARGMVQIFRTDNPLFGKGLSFFQRLCYVNAMLHFLSGIPRIIYLTAPLAFLLAHAYIIYAPAVAILLNVVPHMMHANLTNAHTQGPYRRTFWGEIYETVLAWYIARPTTVALFAPRKGSFNVTAKGGLVEQQYFDWSISHPYVWLALANFAGLGFGIWRIFTGPPHEVPTVLITMAWVFYNLVILGGAIAVAAEVKQIRQSHRVPASLPAHLQLANGHVYPAILTDFSEGGAGLTLNSHRRMGRGDPVNLLLARGERRFSFSGKVGRCIGNSVGIEFDPMSQEQQIDFVQCTFARADSWLAWQDRFTPDRPLHGLRDIVIMGFGGYKRLAEHLPFPLSAVLNGAIKLATWTISFLPRRQPTTPSLKHLV